MTYVYVNKATRLVVRCESFLGAAQSEPKTLPNELAIEWREPVGDAFWTGSDFLPLPPQPSPAHEWSGDALAWALNPALLPTALAEAQTAAQAQVDAAAGRARLRYITDVPGQQATYQRKEQQAREWSVLGFPLPAPSFIQAEADALGAHPQTVAQQVCALADYWAYVKGPEIEAARIAGKAAVRAAETLEAVQAALDAALSELEEL